MRRWPALLRLAVAGALLLPTLGCQPVRLLNALVPKDGYGLRRDLSYGPLAEHRLDVYLPDGLQQPAPMVVFFYGGRWASGAKADYLFVGQALAARGIIAVVPDYRLYPEVRFPGFVEDGAKALAWVRAHAEKLGADPERIFVMGHSAGAHIAALLALDGRYLAAEGTSPRALAGLIGLAGPYDFLPLTDPTLEEIFAVPDLRATQPIAFADRPAPAALLLHGDADRTVGKRNSLGLAARLAAAGNRAVARLYPDLGHIGLLTALAAPFRWRAPVLDDVAGFVAGARPG